MHKFDIFHLIALSLFSIFIIFPANHHLSDAYSYASSVKYGIDLFAPHHLLYNSFNYLIKEFLSIFINDIDVIRLMISTNAVFALLSMFLMRKILLSLFLDKNKAAVWTLLAVCSFGFMRFSTEVETFIIPIFLSLLSTYFFQKHLKLNLNRYALYSGIFASLACLFHQIHLFWGVGLLVGFITNRKLKPTLLYLATTPSVIFIYSLVILFYNNSYLSVNNIFSYIADYYYSDKADVSIGINNIIITIITFTRTFFQVHGSLLLIFEKYMIASALSSLFTTLCMIISFKLLTIKKIKNKISSNVFVFTHLLIFILQLSFAIFSHGNSEFMVMLPFLIAIFLPFIIEINIKSILCFTMGMFMWNFSFGIIPNHYIDYQNNKQLISHIAKNNNSYYILKENYLVSSYYLYEYGNDSYGKIIPIDFNIRDIKISDNTKFYTDIFSKKTPYSRVDFTTSIDTSKIKFIKHTKWINNTMGGFYIDEVKILK